MAVTIAGEILAQRIEPKRGATPKLLMGQPDSAVQHKGRDCFSGPSVRVPAVEIGNGKLAAV